MLGFLVAYMKLPIDAPLFSLANLGWVPERWTEYDQSMTLLKFESNLALGLQIKVMKMLEQIWEALPQLALAITYYVNNKYYIWFSEPQVFGVPTTIISMLLSSGSAMMGLFFGVAATRDVVFINAVKNRNVKRMEFFLKLPLIPADPKMDVSKGVPAITHASENGHVEVVDILIQAGVDVNQKHQDWGRTPLHVASRRGHVEVVNFLIQAGGEVDIQNEMYETPLHWASECGHVEVVKILIQAGGDINSRDERGSTPLHVASGSGHVEAVDILIQAGAEVNCHTEKGDTPLHEASYNGHVKVVNFLIQAGGEVNQQDGKGATPLLRASENGHVEVVNRLIQAGGDVNCQTEMGDTPLHDFSKSGHVEVVNRLIQAGGYVNKKGQYNETPLYQASEKASLRYLYIYLPCISCM